MSRSLTSAREALDLLETAGHPLHEHQWSDANSPVIENTWWCPECGRIAEK